MTGIARRLVRGVIARMEEDDFIVIVPVVILAIVGFVAVLIGFFLAMEALERASEGHEAQIWLAFGVFVVAWLVVAVVRIWGAGVGAPQGEGRP